VTDERSTPAGQHGSGWTRFWFSAVPPALLHRIRIGGGLLILAWMLSFAGHQEALLSLSGWFDYDAYLETDRMTRRALEENAPPPSAPIGWSIFYLAAGDRVLFDALYWGSIFVAALFTLGIATRITGVLTWVAVVSFLANPATSYDADYLIGILAFYLMVAYLLLGIWNGRLTAMEYIFGPKDAMVFARRRDSGREARGHYSYAANVVLRLLQVHFAIIVVTSGLHKLQIGDWWAGVALWYPLYPPLDTSAETLDRLRGIAPLYLGILSLAQYLLLAWEIAFPMFAWRRGWWRVVLIGGAALLWLLRSLVMGLPWFGAFYFVCCLAYLHADEWQRVRGWFGRRSERAGQPHSRTTAKMAVS
jgi:hypothetical protein